MVGYKVCRVASEMVQNFIIFIIINMCIEFDARSEVSRSES